MVALHHAIAKNKVVIFPHGGKKKILIHVSVVWII